MRRSAVYRAGLVVTTARDGERTTPRCANISDNTVGVWEVATGRQAHTLIGHVKSSSYVAFSPDGRWLIAINGKGTVTRWDLSETR